MSALADKKKLRGVKKSLFTRRQKQCEEHLKDNLELDIPLVETLRTSYQELLTAHENVLVLLEESELESDVYLDAVDEKHHELLLKAPLVSLQPPSTSTDHDVKPVAYEQKDQYKIPKVDLKKFSGDILEWLPFYQGFINCVHKKGIPSNIKITILMQHLEGEALDTVKFFSLTDGNYKPALNALNEKYGDPEKLVDAHIELLLDLRDQVESLSLRTLYDKLFSLVNILETLSINREQYGVLLVPMLKSLLTKRIRLEWAKFEAEEKAKYKLATTSKQQVSTMTNRLTLLLNFLKFQVEIQEASEPINKEKEKKSKEKKEDKKATEKKDFKAPEKPAENPLGTAALTNLTSSGSSRETGSSGRGRGYSYHQQRGGYRGRGRGYGNQRSGQLSTGGRFIPPDCPFCRDNHHPDSCRDKFNFAPSVAYQLIVDSRRCLRCLGPHPSNICKFAKSCAICGNDHHPVLCRDRPKISKSPVLLNLSAQDYTTQDQTTTSSATLPAGSQILHQTATVFASAPKAHPSTLVRCLLDSGSERTYVTTAIAQKLQLPVTRHEKIASLAFGRKDTPTPKETPVVIINLKSRTSKFEIETEALCVDVITNGNFSSIKCVDIPFTRTLADIHDADPKIQVLIGLDYYWSIMKSDIIRGPVGQPVGMQSGFGLVLSGPVSTSESTITSLLTSVINLEDDDVKDGPDSETRDLLDRFFKIECVEFELQDDATMDDFAVQTFLDTITFTGERYSVGLPWRPDHPPLLSNRPAAQNRLQKLYDKLGKNPELFAHYETALDEFEAQHYAEPATCLDGQYEYYMPHRPVIKTSSNTYKVRPVFDASAPSLNQISLNDCVLSGPSLAPDIFDVQLRWRQWTYAIIGDIKRAFLQIEIQVSDRDALRYLRRDGQARRFTRVPFGVCSSPFLLNAVIRYHISRQREIYDHELLNDMRTNFYVDDYVSGANSREGLTSKIEQSSEILKSAGMELRGWNTNCKEALAQLPEKSKSNEKCTTVLGTNWNTETDTFSVKPVDTNIEKFTKQTILRVISRVYDILGHFSPVKVRGKILMRKIHELHNKWNDIIHDPDILLESKTVFADLAKISEVTIPRKYLCDEATSLHLFCDASPDAMCVVVYVSSNTWSSFVASKTKVAPIRTKLTIPRLELQACTEGTKLIVRVIQATSMFQNISVHCWTDSMVALGWIRTSNVNSLNEIFVYNRVKKIQDTTSDFTWHYVRSSDNPADLGTRANMTLQSLTESSLWWNGPGWLKMEEQWQKIEITEDKSPNPDSDDIDQEDDTPCLLTKTPKPESSNSVLDNGRGRLTPALRTVAYALRWIYKNREPLPVSDQMLFLPSKNKWTPTPSVEELERAKLRWIKSIQLNHFGKEISSLSQGKTVSPKSPLINFNPILDTNGLLRSLGRTHRNESRGVPPIILPSNAEQFSELLVYDTHEKLFHSGVTSTLSQIRRDFVIIRGRRLVRKVLNKCLICKRHKVLPYLTEPSLLPRWRIESDMPFAKIGIDYAGPFRTKEGNASVLIITCCVTRAVHFEVAPDQTHVSVLQALRRSSSRRGPITLIVSDNARCFIKAKEFMSVKWINIPEKAPWWGGFYERQVQNLKRALKRGIGRAVLSYEELRTIIPEIESVVNRRPITYLSAATDDPLPLRPIDFLIVPEEPTNFEGMSEQEVLDSKFKNRLLVLQHTWKRYREEYLDSLDKWKNFQEGGFEPKVGDVVLLRPEGIKNRAFFPLARIVEVIEGTDGKIRAAYVLCKGNKYRRSTTHLFPLETDLNSIQTQNEQEMDTENSDDKKSDLESESSEDEQNQKELKLSRAGRQLRKVKRYGVND